MTRLVRVAQSEFSIGRGDTGPDLAVYLEDAAGTRPDLTDTTITFRMSRRGSGVYQVEGAATPHADQVTWPGRVDYSWSAGDTDVAGAYLASWEVVWPDDETITFPNDDPWVIAVNETRS